MKSIEQIHLTVRTVRGSRTAEVTALSDGVSLYDAEEIVNWFSEDTAENLIQTRRPSLFFHLLPSGCFALGRINIGGLKPSARSVFTPHISGTFQVHISTIPAETLLLYGNNPFVLEEKLQNERAEGVSSSIDFPKDIELFDEAAVKVLCTALGEYKTAEIIQNISDNISLLLSMPKTIPPIVFLKALFSMLPLRFRTELSFSTETHISGSHLFRLIFTGNNSTEENKRRIEELSALSGVPHKIITEGKNQKDIICSFAPYSQFIFQVIHGNSFAFLKLKLEEEYRIAFAEQVNGEYDSKIISENLTENLPVDWEMLHIPALRYLEEMNEDKTGSKQPSTGLEDIESIKPLLRSSASAEHIITLLKQESKHLTDLLANVQKTK